MGGWGSARPFYLFFRDFWKEIIINKTFLTGEKKNELEKEKEEKEEKQQRSILATHDPAKAVFVITAPERLGYDLGFPEFN